MAKRIWFFTFFLGLLQKISSKEVFLIIEILLVILLSLLNFAVVAVDGHWATQNIIAHDDATFLVTAISYNKDLGVPYKDYWEYRPPGFFFLLVFWSKFFGAHILPFKLLEAGVRFLIGLQIVFLMRKIFSPFQALVVSLLTIIVFFSPAFGQWLYPEAYGIFLSLMGLLCLIYVQRLGLRFFLAAFFFSLSMQMKDTFGGAVIAMMPPLFYLLIFRHYKSFFKGLIFTFLGLLLPLLLLYFYLTSLHSLDAYFEVLRFKSAHNLDNLSHFLSRYYHFLRYANATIFYDYLSKILISGFLFMLFVLFRKKISIPIKVKNHTLVLRIPFLTLSINSQRLNLVTVLFYSLGSLIGPSRQYLFTPHYLFSIIIPLSLFWSIIAFFMENSLRSLFRIHKRNLIFLFFIFLLLFPKNWIIGVYREIPVDAIQHAYKNLTLLEADISVERYINSKTNHQDCVLSLYGWKSAEIYLYSERKPCTRFIIPNIVIDEWQKKEYRTAILENPPQAIVYSLWGADMNHPRFEEEVINVTRILANCYQQDLKYTYGRWPLELYFPVLSGEKLKTCIQKNAL